MSSSTRVARILVDELVRGGVTDVVLCPGSRSAPLAYALHDADTAGRLRLHVRIDERSGGFLALGLAKVTGHPVPVVTTSGTATANLHPAVMEASYAGVPLVALTADRPVELVGVGANQTVDQSALYGAAPRAVFSIPADEAASNGWLRSTTCRVLAAAMGVLTRDPGPVHLNVAFREPLVPTGLDPSAGLAAEDAGRPDGGPWTVSAGLVEHEPEMYAGDPKTLVLVGDGTPAQAATARRVAVSTGWPVLSEAVSGVRGLPLSLLDDPVLLEHALPQRVLVVGRLTLSRGVTALQRRQGLVVDVLSGSRWADVAAVAGTAYSGDLEPLGWVDEAFAAAWRAAGAAAQGIFAGSWPWPSGPGVAAAVVGAVPADGLVVVGASNPVRDLDLVAGLLPATAAVLANRGVSGIDGTISTAVGAALGHQAAGGGPAYAVLGDLTFLHDSNGLVLGPQEPRPDLCLVVVNDDGGGIFTLLEQGAPELAAPFERIFGTPHGVDLASLCAATGTPYRRAQAPADLQEALRPCRGVRVVEVRLDRSNRRAEAADLRRRLRDAVADALAGLEL